MRRTVLQQMPGPPGPAAATARLQRLRVTPTPSLTDSGARHQLQSLRAFLERAGSAPQWDAALRSVKDALLHNVKVGKREYETLFDRLTAARKPDVAKNVVKELTDRQMCSPSFVAAVLRPGLLRVLAAVGDFNESKELVTRLLAAGSSSGSASGNQQLTSSELELAMNAALSALRKKSTARDDAGLPLWKSAVSLFVKCRTHPASRDSAPLTPGLVHAACQLLELGGNWHAAISVLAAADKRLIPVEDRTLDVVVRTAFVAEKHLHVVRVLDRCISANTAPHEATVRMGIIACDEVSSYHSSAWALACQLLQGLTDNGLPVLPVTVENVVRCCATSPAGRWDMALTVAANMAQSGMVVSQPVLKVAIAKRIEHCRSTEEAEIFAGMPMFTSIGRDQRPDLVKMYALMRCAVNLRDWNAYRRYSMNYVKSEAPITSSKLILQMEASHLLGEHSRVVAQFVKFALRVLRLYRPDENSQMSGDRQKIFGVYFTDVYLRPEVWALVDDSIAKMEKEAPNMELVRRAKLLSKQLARLRDVDEMRFGPGDVDLVQNHNLLPEHRNAGADDPSWAYSAEERRAMHPGDSDSA